MKKNTKWDYKSVSSPFQDFGRSLPCESGIHIQGKSTSEGTDCCSYFREETGSRKFCIVKPRPKLGLAHSAVPTLFVLATEASIWPV